MSKAINELEGKVRCGKHQSDYNKIEHTIATKLNRMKFPELRDLLRKTIPDEDHSQAKKKML